MQNPIIAQNYSDTQPAILQKEIVLKSKYLHRQVHITVLLPPHYEQDNHHFPVLYLNDGQDLPKLEMTRILADLYRDNTIPPFILVGIHADKHRIQEYGTASQADYAQRGAKAAAHTQFVLEELMPFLQQNFRTKSEAENTFFAGFSLGGLSAMDIVWHHADKFSRAGVFSGSLWWRSKPYEGGYNEDTDRIMHNLVREGQYKPNLRFWLQAGTDDETADRNNNGIIDAIDDTLDLIKELKNKGYHDEQIVYYEMQGGTHDQATWAKAMPVFLQWLFKKS
ncbi:MAG: alpha/beta hydrolase-fold protein [Microscillaceae bacterium]|nr:alpha/beta hydrolase-fold protein [Microscillaceae bacterium]